MLYVVLNFIVNYSVLGFSTLARKLTKNVNSRRLSVTYKEWALGRQDDALHLCNVLLKLKLKNSPHCKTKQTS